MGMTEEVRSESAPAPRESAAGTIRVTLDFPAAVLEEFHAASREREAAHLGWQSLEDYLRNHALASLLDAHQRRIMANARTACLLLGRTQESEMNARRAWLHRIAPDEGGIRRTGEKEGRKERGT
jgi:hypothetical protein